MNTDLSDLPGFLAGSPLFSGLSPDELSRIVQSSTVTDHLKGCMVFRVGDACDAFHIVVRGQVKLFVVSLAGQEKVIELISPGQSFAEALVFLDKPCILSAQTLTDTVLVNVSKRGVFSEIEQDPHFALHMLAGISPSASWFDPGCGRLRVTERPATPDWLFAAGCGAASQQSHGGLSPVADT